MSPYWARSESSNLLHNLILHNDWIIGDIQFGYILFDYILVVRQKLGRFNRTEWVQVEEFSTQDGLCRYLNDAIESADIKFWQEIIKIHFEDIKKAENEEQYKKYCGFDPKKRISTPYD